MSYFIEADFGCNLYKTVSDIGRCFSFILVMKKELNEKTKILESFYKCLIEGNPDKLMAYCSRLYPMKFYADAHSFEEIGENCLKEVDEKPDETQKVFDRFLFNKEKQHDKNIVIFKNVKRKEIVEFMEKEKDFVVFSGVKKLVVSNVIFYYSLDRSTVPEIPKEHMFLYIVLVRKEFLFEIEKLKRNKSLGEKEISIIDEKGNMNFITRSQYFSESKKDKFKELNPVKNDKKTQIIPEVFLFDMSKCFPMCPTKDTYLHYYLEMVYKNEFGAPRDPSTNHPLPPFVIWRQINVKKDEVNDEFHGFKPELRVNCCTPNKTVYEILKSNEDDLKRIDSGEIKLCIVRDNFIRAVFYHEEKREFVKFNLGSLVMMNVISLKEKNEKHKMFRVCFMDRKDRWDKAYPPLLIDAGDSAFKPGKNKDCIDRLSEEYGYGETWTRRYFGFDKSNNGTDVIKFKENPLNKGAESKDVNDFLVFYFP